MRKRWFLGFVIATGLLVMGAGPHTGSGKTVRLTAHLQGTQEVPPADLDAKGKAVVKIDVDAGTVCFDVSFRRGVGTPNRGHIHEGAAGANGPIVITFFELRIPPADPGAPASDPRNDKLERGGLKDCVLADKGLLAKIVANPEGYYVNLHNARYPGGAFRCQLED